LVWCFEVAEHIHSRYVENFIDNLCRHSDLVTLSAAPPGQGGEGISMSSPKRIGWRSFQAAATLYTKSGPWDSGQCKNTTRKT
jgi:hypothetical protein